jgi:hypothetical protein
VRLPLDLASAEDLRRNMHKAPPGVPDHVLAESPRHRPWHQFVVTDKIRPGSVHAFRLRYRNGVGWAEHSPSSFEALAPSDVPLAPFDLFTTSLSPFSILVRWKAPHHNGAPLQGYRLQACRMRGCTDPDDSDSEEDCPPMDRLTRLDMMHKGARMPLSGAGCMPFLFASGVLMCVCVSVSGGKGGGSWPSGEGEGAVDVHVRTCRERCILSPRR